jgi:ABC-type Fe3+-citrate transport system substrate-binding protein
MSKEQERKLARHRRALARHHQQVEAARRTFQAAIKARNDALRAAKDDGLPAREAYELAHVSQSTFSRRRQGGGAVDQ